jgi:long-chain acyl-CoA synthetase
VSLEPGDLWFQSVLAAQSGRPAPRVTVGPDDPAVILMSGGTTGTPKGVLGLHRAYVMAGMQLRAWEASLLREWDDTVMLPLPLFHVYANVGVQSFSFMARAPLALVPNPRDISDVLKTVRRVRPAFFNGVPTLYIAMLNHPDVKNRKVDFSSIKLCFSGAAPLLADTKQRFEALTGGRIVEGYSLTEALMACCVNPVRGHNKLGSIGMPLPDVEVRIMDDDQGTRPMPHNEVGELCLRAPQLMPCYWRNAEETALVLRDHGDGGLWLHTGDLAYLDEDGFVFIVDRKKDLIKTSGFQVWPREIEEVLASHPAVKEVGVAGVPDPVKGEAVKAWVVLRTGESTDTATLRAWCKERLAPYKVPSQVEFRDELPKTMVGKVLRRLLASGQG